MANTGLLNNHRQSILFSIGPGAWEITVGERSGLNALKMLSPLALSGWAEQEQVGTGLNYSLHDLFRAWKNPVFSSPYFDSDEK